MQDLLLELLSEFLASASSLPQAWPSLAAAGAAPTLAAALHLGAAEKLRLQVNSHSRCGC